MGGKLLKLSEGVLEQGDFLGLMSDGVLYADKDVTMNTQWGWNEVVACLEMAAQDPKRLSSGHGANCDP